MEIIQVKTKTLKKNMVYEINEVVAAGFGVDTTTMLPDTQAHIESADIIQIAKVENSSIAAIAMYRRCLWWESN